MATSDNGIIRNFNRYVSGLLSGQPEYDYTDKESNIAQHISYMFTRTQSMFRWKGLPETIPSRVLELYLQINGNTCFYEHKNKLYVFVGGLGGEPDVYYMPTIYTIANPALNISKQLVIDKDCVVMSNDAMYMGLVPMFTRYGTGLVETELSINIASINSRIFNLISAPDDRTKVSAEKYLKDVTDGKLGVIADNAFLDGIKSQPYGSTSNSNVLTNLIELEQYLKASWFNEIGLNANYNMKRESLNSSESQMNNDALLPLIDNMLECRQIGADKVNKMFGTNITVELGSSWEDNEEEIELEHGEITPEEPEEPEEMGDSDDRTESE